MPRNRMRPSRRVLLILCATAVCLFVFAVYYHTFATQYKATVSRESTSHLQEINSQITSFIAKSIRDRWQLAYTFGETLSMAKGDEEAIKGVLQKERERWDYADVCVCMLDGTGINADGKPQNVDDVSKLTLLTHQNEKVINILASTVTFAVKLDEPVPFGDTSVVAIASKKDISTMLDGLSIASFGGSAELYLVREEGQVIARYLQSGQESVFNVKLLFDEGTILYLDEEHQGGLDPLSLNDACAFLYQPSQSVSKYVMVSPVGIGALKLVYTVPEDVLNAATQSFSSYLTGMSLIIVAAMLVLSSLLFVSVYRNRKHQLERVISSRERLFDLLVAETNYAFGLLSRTQKEPLYITANTEALLGDEVLYVDTTRDALQMTTRTGATSVAIETLNRELLEWDGTSAFVSSYLPHSAHNAKCWHTVVIYPVPSDPDELIIIVEDVTEEREHEAALRNALAAADSSNKAKTIFLSNMSHDIRTPMNAIINMTDFALESIREPDKLASYLETIRSSSQHLLRLINDILDMSRIESGNIEVVTEPFVLPDVLDTVADVVKPIALGKKQVFIANTQVTSQALQGDTLKLSQVLVNLLNNAVKFTPEGGTVELSAEEAPGFSREYRSFRFTVRDTGIGIPAETLPTIFEPFTRVNTSIVRRTEGSGLGLSIAKRYVSVMGGVISVVSKENVGTTFTVEIPFKTASEAPRETQPNSVPPIRFVTGARVLLCEDNEINRKIAGLMLTKMGLEVEYAFDGGEGLCMFLSSAVGYYSLIFMDIQMPVMDGYEVTLRIRASEHADAKTIPIIAMTANVFVEDVEKARAAGMNDHVGKPVEIKVLAAAIQKALGGKKQ